MLDNPPKITPIHYFPKHCTQCGGLLKTKFIDEEKQDRLACPSCGTVAYLNPLPVAGAIPVVDGKILLLRRGIQPAKSAWTFPAGFVELGESVRDAAVRETLEEVGVHIQVRSLLGVYSYGHDGVVTVVYDAEITGGTARISHEAEEIQTFSKNNIPWVELAFKSTTDALKDWVRSQESS